MPRMFKCISILLHIIHLVLKLCKPNGGRAVIAENLILRQQLIVLQRKYRRSPNLTFFDRLIFAILGANVTSARLLKIAITVKPSTIIAFHKALVKRKYKTLYSPKTRRKPGPIGPSDDLIKLIIEMKLRNPRFGCPRIAMQINNIFGLDINKDVVRRILEKHYKPDPNDSGPSWLSFIGNIKDSLWSVDFFRVESITLNSYWIMLVMDQFTRRIIGYAIHKGDLNGVAACCMFSKITKGNPLPKYLSSDNDPIFQFQQWKANLRILEIDEIKSVPYTPRSHPFVERMIRTTRNEFLDQILFFNSTDLERKLEKFKKYYNDHRVHSSLNGHTPFQKANITEVKTTTLVNFRWKSCCNNLFSLPMAA